MISARLGLFSFSGGRRATRGRGDRNRRGSRRAADWRIVPQSKVARAGAQSRRAGFRQHPRAIEFRKGLPASRLGLAVCQIV